MPISRIKKFLQQETTGGIILVSAALLGLILENSPIGSQFINAYSAPLFKVENPHIPHSFLTIINDGLMTLFFLLISLEIKRELIIGELNSRSKAILPVIAALGGMIVPALIFILINLSEPYFLAGWAIPTATDIAFSIAILSLLSKHIPITLKTFLLALALIDDLGAIVIIAIFYTKYIAWQWLLLSFLCIFILIAFNFFKIKNIFSYVLIGIFLWIALAYSGIHATLAGVIVGFIIPLKNPALLQNVEKKIHPWVAYLTLPLFALVNAGFPFSGFTLDNIFSTLSVGIILGLFLGKPLGIFFASFLSYKLGLTELPKNVRWRHIFGVSILCGMGFTMSLYIETLAFPSADIKNHLIINFAVVFASLLSAIVGYLVLFQSSKPKPISNKQPSLN